MCPSSFILLKSLYVQVLFPLYGSSQRGLLSYFVVSKKKRIGKFWRADMPITFDIVRNGNLLGIHHYVHYTVGYLIRLAAPLAVYAFYLYYMANKTIYIGFTKNWSASSIFDINGNLLVFGPLFLFAFFVIAAIGYSALLMFELPEPALVKWFFGLVLLITAGVYIFTAFWVGLNGLLFTVNGLIGDPACFIMTAFTILFLIPLFIMIAFINQ